MHYNTVVSFKTSSLVSHIDHVNWFHFVHAYIKSTIKIFTKRLLNCTANVSEFLMIKATIKILR